MRIISRRELRDFAASHANAGTALDAWYRIAKSARWKNLVDVKATWRSAEIVGSLTVFNIKGNTYRLITRIHYGAAVIYVRAVLTHQEYDKGDWKQL